MNKRSDTSELTNVPEPKSGLPANPFGTEITAQDIAETLSFFDDWEDRYRYIIDIGKELPALPDAFKTDENFVHGCQSQVWLACEYNEHDDLLTIAVDSDAHIVKGLAGIVLSAFNKKTPHAIADFNIEGFFTDIDLLGHLSLTRGNGLRAMVKKIRHLAEQLH